MEPPPHRFNIARHCLGRHADTRPDKTALIIAGADGAARSWSYGELDLAVRRLAGGLTRMGLARGDRLMIRMENDLGYVLTFFAALAAGLVPLPSSAALTGEEAEFLLSDAHAAALALARNLALAHDPPDGVRQIAADEIDALARQGEPALYADTAAEDPAFLIYTSGTGGEPKGVLHGHRTAWGRRPMYADWYGITEDDVVLHAGAFNWTYTLGVGLIDPWANGATAVLYNGPPDPGVWPDLIERFSVSIFATVPSVYRRILKYADVRREKLASLRHGLCAGEPLLPSVLEGWRAATGTELYEALGMSEISTYISTGPGMTIKPGSPGRPQRGRRVAIIAADAPGEEDEEEEGENENETPADAASGGGSGPPRVLAQGEIGLLAVHRSDPGLMLGYWRREQEEARVYRGAWFCGGDLAHMDADGYVWFHGRHDDVLNPGAHRLSPLEIERVLARHPSVQEVAVGEWAVAADTRILAAFVVPHDRQDLDEAGLLAHAGAHLADYKVPRKVVFVDRLPRTRNGKIARRKLPRGESAKNGD